MEDRTRNLLEWALVAAVSFGLMYSGFSAGRKLSANSWVDLKLPACAPTEVVKKVNMGGACDMNSFDVGTLIEYDGKVFAVTNRDYYTWIKTKTSELKLTFTERKVK